jgi:hypothetical protein
MAATQHNGAADQAVGHLGRQCLHNELQRVTPGDAVTTLAVNEFGLNSKVLGLGQKVHFGTRLATTRGAPQNSLDKRKG